MVAPTVEVMLRGIRSPALSVAVGSTESGLLLRGAVEVVMMVLLMERFARRGPLSLPAPVVLLAESARRRRRRTVHRLRLAVSGAR